MLINSNYINLTMFSLTQEEKRFLLKLARKAIETWMKDRVKLPAINVPKRLMEPKGVFVTLKKHGELRGCIGYPLPVKPLAEAVIDNALNAAFNDPRFPPLSPEELKEVEIEITVLTEPEPINYRDSEDLKRQIKIGRDGLIIRYGWYSGLLLPQVPVEQGWDVEEYLNYLCIKAGLPADFWKREHPSIERFEGVCFSE